MKKSAEFSLSLKAIIGLIITLLLLGLIYLIVTRIIGAVLQ